MLETQLANLSGYSGLGNDFKVVIVDDGSPEPAEPIVRKWDLPVRLFRIEDDIPWNREQARNLGAYVCDTQWLIQVDIDHILPNEHIPALLNEPLELHRWYRFPRFRVGRADDTRQKDHVRDDPKYRLGKEEKFGQISPHIDSYLITRKMFMTSPYDERYSGCLGGGSPFLARMTRLYKDAQLLPEPIQLHVYTKDTVADASITTLDRDTEEYTRRRAAIESTGDDKPKRILYRSAWHEVDLGG